MRRCLSLVEGHLDGDGLEQFLADLDVDLGAALGILGLDKGGADILSGAGAVAARTHLADLVALGVADLVAVTGDTAVHHLEAGHFALEASGFLSQPTIYNRLPQAAFLFIKASAKNKNQQKSRC